MALDSEQQPPPLPAFHPQTPAQKKKKKKSKWGFRDPVPGLSWILGVLVAHVYCSAVPANRDAMTKAEIAPFPVAYLACCQVGSVGFPVCNTGGR